MPQQSEVYNQRDAIVLRHTELCISAVCRLVNRGRAAGKVPKSEIKSLAALASVMAATEYQKDRGTCSVSKWMYFQTQRRAVDILRKELGQRGGLRKKSGLPENSYLWSTDAIPDDAPETLSFQIPATQLEDFLRQEAIQQVQRALQTLPYRLRKVLQLRFWGGHCVSDVGKRMRVSESQVYRLRYAALGQMRQALTAVGGGL